MEWEAPRGRATPSTLGEGSPRKGRQRDGRQQESGWPAGSGQEAGGGGWAPPPPPGSEE